MAHPSQNFALIFKHSQNFLKMLKHTRGSQKVSPQIFFVANYWSKKIEKNTGRFVKKFLFFPRNFLTNLNILCIVYGTFVNQRDSKQCPNFGSTPQPLL